MSTGSDNAQVAEIVPIVLAGGSGTRLWPFSRESYPKQFLNVLGDRSLLQGTLARVMPEAESNRFAQPLLVCNEEHRFLVAEQARAAGCTPQLILLEPAGRNTAPALTVAALLVHESDPVLVMSPAVSVIVPGTAAQSAMSVSLVLIVKKNFKILLRKPSMFPHQTQPRKADRISNLDCVLFGKRNVNKAGRRSTRTQK